MKFVNLMICMLLVAGIIGSTASMAASERDMDATLDRLFSSHQNYHVFFDTFKHQVALKSISGVAGLVSYPISVKLNGKKVQIKDPRQLMKHYNAIFTPEIINIVARQKYNDLVANEQGVMMGNGQIWFSSVCQDNQCKKSDVLITGINQ